MTPTDALTYALFGEPRATSGKFGNSTAHMRSQFRKMLTELEALSQRSNSERALYVPFVARSVLEIACYAMIGRVDPLRVLFVVGLQNSSDYDSQKAYQCSIHWSGDVVSKEVKTLWSETNKATEMTRALFGDYLDHLVWREAFDAIDLSEFTGVAFRLLQSVDSENFASMCRMKIGRLYSRFSKGVHHEVFLPPETMFDPSTLTNSVNETLHLLSCCGLVLSHCEWAQNRSGRSDLSAVATSLANYEVNFV